jgi:hypothetical protein
MMCAPTADAHCRRQNRMAERHRDPHCAQAVWSELLLDRIMDDVDASTVVAWVAAGVSMIALVIGAYVTVWSAQRQRSVDLIGTALAQMGGGSQNRSAGVAALLVLRGPIERQPRRLAGHGWTTAGPAVGQQLFRQLIYVLLHGKGRFVSHEVETLIVMANWLLRDQLLAFGDAGQRRRLARAMQKYEEDCRAEMAKTSTISISGSLEELLSRLPGWIADLTSNNP